MASCMRCFGSGKEPEATSAEGCMIIQFPWDPSPYVQCGSCGKRVSTVYAQYHALVDRYEYGCGVKFTHVASPSGEESIRELSDLPYRHVAFAS